MKTKTLIFGLAIAIISTLTISNAQAQDEPAVKVISGLEKNSIKVIYGYNTKASVEVKFITREGVLGKDEIQGKNFHGGFMKSYNLNVLQGEVFWVEVGSNELSATFKMTPYKNGKWTAQLEKSSYNHTALAKR